MVVFPHPDSPTREKVCPLLIVKDTSSTACKLAIFFLNIPPITGYLVTKFLTSRSGFLVPTILLVFNLSFELNSKGSGYFLPIMAPNLGTEDINFFV